MEKSVVELFAVEFSVGLFDIPHLDYSLVQLNHLSFWVKWPLRNYRIMVMELSTKCNILCVAPVTNITSVDSGLNIKFLKILRNILWLLFWL